jgi:ATP-binding cassette subfamily C (CFTR/MRP) protein 1
LDDVFSGLDPITEDIIFRNLLGNDGLLRCNNQTVILATHGSHLLSKADLVVLLGKHSEIIYQGSYSTFPTELISRVDLPNSTAPADPERVATAEKTELVIAEEFMPLFHSDSKNVAVPNDLARQTGDAKIYGYYLRTMGIKHTLLFIVLGATCMGFTPAQSKSRSTKSRINGH